MTWLRDRFEIPASLVSGGIEMNGMFDGMFSVIIAVGFLILSLIFFVLKLSGVLLLSWWLLLVPVILFIVFIVIAAQPGAP